MLTDSWGNMKESYTYDAFGNQYGDNPFGHYYGSGWLTGAENEYGYNGKGHDSDAGLSDYGFRDYSPLLGRFTTVDPIKSGSNWYAYVGNDPVNFIDLWGLTASDAQTVSDLPFSFGIDPNLTGTVIRGEFVSLSAVARIVIGEGTAYEYDNGSLVDQYDINTFSIGFETNVGAEVGKYQSVYENATKDDILGTSNSGDAQAGYIISESVSSDTTSTGKSSITLSTTLGVSIIPVGVGYNFNLTSEATDNPNLTTKDRSDYYNQYYTGE